MTIDELVQLGISHGSVHAILSDDLKMKRVSAKFVLRLLRPDQMETRLLTAAECFEKSTEDPTFLEAIVTGDETWTSVAEKNILLLHQPPYSPDLSPSDFWLFPKIKMGLKGNHFDTVEDIKINATVELRKINRTSIVVSSNGRSGGAIVCAEGSYFEGD
ncbi:hypothetical protein AVEN_147561-1 [Araneus ventricosus]|uniref:Tc1-like transposase DDE domain-containing protein n=1 Tax=Araneus ventricosus TaxID=182803 RepID=A0A4Y1ZUU2_ARAVE|nr:hypothetical protein AVEN_147561-1 [Araneus ventricosus]